MQRFELWTDGSCYPNPGPGGWAFVLVDETGRPIGRDSGHVEHATNNTMEITAAIMGLRFANETISVEVVTDSHYLANAFLKGWTVGWRRRGWKTRDHLPVANKELWVELIEVIDARERAGGVVTWRTVKGHSGVGLNEVVDHMAAEARKEGVAV